MATPTHNAPVLVTGASGYLGSWLVRLLLEDGHTVRGTVRDPDKATGLEHLHALAEAHPGRLTLHRADLLDDGSFTEPMDGCAVVFHTASPFVIGTIKDPQAQFVTPALEGTRTVLESANAVDSVTRVVLTSSIAAMFGDNVEMQGRGPFTDADWNTTSSLEHGSYSYSKTVAEQLAWEIHDAQDRWDLVTVNPGFVLGPSLTTASASGSLEMLGKFVDGSMAFGAPSLTFAAVDVRDAARVHVAAAYTPEARGRYIAYADSVTLLEMADILRDEFGGRRSFPKRELPKFLIKLAAPAAGMTRTYVERNIGYPLRFDARRTVSELGVSFRPVAESVVDHYRQMLADGLA